MAVLRHEISLSVLKYFSTCKEISYLQAAMQCFIYYYKHQ